MKKLLGWLLIFNGMLNGYEYDHISLDVIAQYLPKNPVILEAGAYIGTETYNMARYWGPDATIYTFEPIPEIFSQLQAKVAGFTNVFLFNQVLSDTIGQLLFYVSYGDAHGASSSLYEPTQHLTEYPEISFNRTIMVESTTIDAWAANQGIDHIDFMWLDMQGAEPQALKAAPNILKTVKVIFTEVNLTQVYKDIILFEEFSAWLNTQGFTCKAFELERAKYGNALFVRDH